MWRKTVPTLARANGELRKAADEPAGARVKWAVWSSAVTTETREPDGTIAVHAQRSSLGKKHEHVSVCCVCRRDDLEPCHDPTESIRAQRVYLNVQMRGFEVNCDKCSSDEMNLFPFDAVRRDRDMNRVGFVVQSMNFSPVAVRCCISSRMQPGIAPGRSIRDC
jgi:hypothetical protein